MHFLWFWSRKTIRMHDIPSNIHDTRTSSPCSTFSKNLWNARRPRRFSWSMRVHDIRCISHDSVAVRPVSPSSKTMEMHNIVCVSHDSGNDRPCTPLSQTKKMFDFHLYVQWFWNPPPPPRPLPNAWKCICSMHFLWFRGWAWLESWGCGRRWGTSQPNVNEDIIVFLDAPHQTPIRTDYVFWLPPLVFRRQLSDIPRPLALVQKIGLVPGYCSFPRIVLLTCHSYWSSAEQSLFRMMRCWQNII